MFDEATEELAARLGVHFQKPLVLAQGLIDPAEVGKSAAVPAPKRLERDIVFHIVELARRFAGGLALARGGGLFRFPGTCVARPLPAAQHLHAVGDDFGGSAFLPFLVLPLARAQGSLDIDLRALLAILAGDFRE